MQPSDRSSSPDYETGPSTVASEETKIGKEVRLKELRTEDEEETPYATGKPRRIVIRARITHDEG